MENHISLNFLLDNLKDTAMIRIFDYYNKSELAYGKKKDVWDDDPTFSREYSLHNCLKLNESISNVICIYID